MKNFKNYLTENQLEINFTKKNTLNDNIYKQKLLSEYKFIIEENDELYLKSYDIYEKLTIPSLIKYLYSLILINNMSKNWIYYDIFKNWSDDKSNYYYDILSYVGSDIFIGDVIQIDIDNNDFKEIYNFIKNARNILYNKIPYIDIILKEIINPQATTIIKQNQNSYNKLNLSFKNNKIYIDGTLQYNYNNLMVTKVKYYLINYNDKNNDILKIKSLIGTNNNMFDRIMYHFSASYLLKDVNRKISNNAYSPIIGRYDNNLFNLIDAPSTIDNLLKYSFLKMFMQIQTVTYRTLVSEKRVNNFIKNGNIEFLSNPTEPSTIEDKAGIDLYAINSDNRKTTIQIKDVSAKNRVSKNHTLTIKNTLIDLDKNSTHKFDILILFNKNDNIIYLYDNILSVVKGKYGISINFGNEYIYNNIPNLNMDEINEIKSFFPLDNYLSL